MARLIYLLAVALLVFTSLMAPACQFDGPGQTHEQYLEWVNARNKQNAELAKGKNSPQVAKQEKKAAPEISRGYRAPRTINSGSPVIRIGR